MQITVTPKLYSELVRLAATVTRQREEQFMVFRFGILIDAIAVLAK